MQSSKNNDFTPHKIYMTFNDLVRIYIFIIVNMLTMTVYFLF